MIHNHPMVSHVAVALVQEKTDNLQYFVLQGHVINAEHAGHRTSSINQQGVQACHPHQSQNLLTCAEAHRWQTA